MSYSGRGSLFPNTRDGRQRQDYRESRRHSDEEEDEDDDYSHDSPRDGIRTPVPGTLSHSYSGSVNAGNEHYETRTTHSGRRYTQADTIPSQNTAPQTRTSYPHPEAGQQPAPSTLSNAAPYDRVRVFEGFTEIATTDFETLRQYVNRYPRILQEDEKAFQARALDALMHEDVGRFDRCLHRALIILNCKRSQLDSTAAARFISNLSRRGEDYNNFMIRFNQARVKLHSHAQAQNTSTSATHVTSPVAGLQNVTGTLAEMNLGNRGIPYGGRASEMNLSRGPDPRIETRAPGDEVLVQFNTHGLPSKVGQKPQITGANTKSLSADYKVRKNPERFFTFGKVFKVLWHQPAGANTDGRVNPTGPCTNGAFNEPIYSALRWMMVVAPKKGYCICCPISTYSGKGLKYKKLHDAEIRAHAIVYASGSRPCALRDEPSMTKDPIKINMNGDDGLDPASRIHFGKYHTVEYNVKVMELGQVDKAYEERVASYFVRELSGQ